MKSTFNKHERLHSEKQIQQLFSNGRSMFIYPFKVVFMKVGVPGLFPVQLLVSVSKHSFKKAVDRNKIKRLTREAYRTNKKLVYEKLGNENSTMFLGLIYIGKTILSYQEIERKIILILHRLNEEDGQAAG